MLRRAAIAALMLASSTARAEQDPELEREDTERTDSTDTADDTAEDTTKVVEQPSVPWKTELEARVRAGAGAIRGGDTINPGAGAISIVGGELTAALRRARLELAVPLEYSHRQTFATSLTEVRGRGGGRVSYRFSRQLQATAELGLGAVWKPDWVDPFQPLADGGLATTNRYSHWDRRASAEVVVRPKRRHRVRVAYDYVLSVYDHDPMFDAIYDPIHLAPWDRDMHRVDAEWRLREHDGAWKLRLGAQASRWQYFFLFAGDANTGITHAGPGGEPPNPLLELRALEPRIDVELQVGDWWLVRARYELELMQDPHAGYLSYVGHHPEVTVTWEDPRIGEVKARAELFIRRYGDNSYDYDSMDPMHPPLAWGDRRAERLGYFSLAGRKRLGVHWAGVAEAKLAVRRTNYAYSIDWNYVNYLAWAGAEYRY
jgi:hypothetical protein